VKKKQQEQWMTAKITFVKKEGTIGLWWYSVANIGR
jgi:hypothetical protein